MGSLTMNRRSFVKGAAGVAGLAACGSLIGASQGMFGEAHADDDSSGTVVVPGLCHSCHMAKCSLNYKVRDGVLIGVEGNPDGPYNKGKCCVRGQAAPSFVYNPYRVKKPLKRTNPEKGLDVDPGWVEIDYEEATKLIYKKLKAIRKDDPRKLLWLGGFATFYNTLGGMYAMPPQAFGTPNYAQCTGNLCSVHLSNGLVRGGFVQWSDWGRCKYVLAVGGTAGPNIAPGDGGTDYIIDCIKDGARLVVVDPRCTPEAQLGEWQPIKPGTDFAFLLAIEHVMLHEEKRFDEWFVKKRTTGPYLIYDEDYLRNAAGEPLIWDAASSKAVPFHTQVADYTLEGTFEVDGKQATTAFTLLNDGVKDNTPEWASEICGIEADTIRRITKELLDYAQIGDTIVIDGEELPLRPAHVYNSRGLTNHRDGHLAYWTAMVINELLGAIDVPGGNICAADPEALKPNEDGVVTPEDFHCKMYEWQFPHAMLQAQEFMPYGFDNAARVIDVIHDPERYQAEYLPEMMITAGGNYFTKAGDAEYIAEALRQIPFIATVSYHIDEHAMFADVVIPDTTYIEQPALYNFEMYRPGNGQIVNCCFGHKHIIDPVFGQKIVDEFWMEVAEKAKFLHGMGALNFLVNVILELREDLWLNIDEGRYSLEDIIDRRVQTLYGETLDEFAKRGFGYDEVTPAKMFNYAYYPGGKTRHPLYNVYLVRARRQLFAGMDEAGVEHPGIDRETFEWYYRGVPNWRPTLATDPPDGFDMTGLIFKIPQLIFDVSGPSNNPWLIETASLRPDFGKFNINSQTAAEKGLSEGDEIYAENMEGTKIGPYPVHISDLVIPGVLAVAGGNGHAGGVYSEWAKKNIPFNRLISSGWETADVVTGARDNTPRLKITKA